MILNAWLNRDVERRYATIMISGRIVDKIDLVKPHPHGGDFQVFQINVRSGAGKTEVPVNMTTYRCAALSVMLAAAVLVLPHVAEAQEPTTSQQRIAAVRVQPPVTIDGRIDDPAWQRASHVSGFTQRRPVEGSPASERTDVWVAYDSERIYVAIHAHYTDPSLVRANRVDRDQTDNDDTVSVILDPFLDQQRGYSFSVNAFGVQADAIVGSSAGGGTDRAWDVLYDSAGMLVDDGWTAELSIPFRSLRYPSRAPGERHRWGFQIQREIRSKDETVTWSPVFGDIMGTLAQMGTLEGMQDLSTQRNLELLPTVTAVRTDRLESTGRFVNDDIAEAGLNVKYGLTPNVTLDVTFNPDFSQIESDRAQIEVNQRFPLFFPELRPFFLEGQEIFQVLGPFNFLHTRTIVDPEYGVKLTGKTGNTSFGLLAANDRAAGRAVDPGAPGGGGAAQVISGRVRYDLGRESFVGVLFNNREFADQHSRLAVLDGSYRIGMNHRIQTTAAISDHVDASGARRTGHVFDIGMVKQSRSLGYLVAQNLVSPGYGNDLGFIPRVNYAKTWTYVSYRWWPESWIINWGPRLEYNWLYDYDGELQEANVGLNFQATFAENIRASATVSRVMERFLEQDFFKTRLSLSADVNTSRRVSFSVRMNQGDEIRFVESPFLGRTVGYSLSSTLRPFSRLQSQLRFNTTRFTEFGTGAEVFDIKIFDARTTYQFTERLLIRNILEQNTLDKTLGVNLLITYRINAGTVFFVGYDDRFRQGDRIDPERYGTDVYQRTNRAIFSKVQYLFRN